MIPMTDAPACVLTSSPSPDGDQELYYSAYRIGSSDRRTGSPIPLTADFQVGPAAAQQWGLAPKDARLTVGCFRIRWNDQWVAYSDGGVPVAIPRTVGMWLESIMCGLWILLSLSWLGAAGCAKPSPKLPEFDGAKAYDLLKKQCDFGPRYAGTEAHEKTIRYLGATLRSYGLKVNEQTFTGQYMGTDYSFTNIIAEHKGSATTHVLLCAHWDTRQMADQEIDLVKQKKPILGANDGASGVAVLLEVARLIKESPPAASVTIVLFDGEDFGFSDKGGMFYGSKYYAKKLAKPYPTYGILLDMIGDKDLRIPKEYTSYVRARKIVNKVWDAAKASGHDSAFVNEVGDEISDDHIPLLAIGVPCIDVIDFDYAYWHTLDDTADKCSAASLKTVGDTIVRVVWSEQ